MRFGYTIVYVPDVERAVSFYEAAFGFARGYVAPEGTYGELATGDTKLAFVVESQARALTGGFRGNDPSAEPPGVEIALVTDDVAAAFARAVGAGGAPVLEPARQPWGQTIAYVRDPNGVLVELAQNEEPSA